ncbi:hypothetical protein E2R51_02425 [Jeotgalibacillus sp. S-D1]|uniref:hypothetical protein n=1 Tax=Jeotgalibacillus sp. S-D1 TaxID=2552189 RepID=UPI001059D591|nr:hypothetical protein [Jeotgalibacillus sp. S-D1]TDL34593.1 hypothetical protein E2R51_02425 [Jeotgalibacillus sp. S-D1]
MTEIICMAVVGTSLITVSIVEDKLEKNGKYVESRLVGSLFHILLAIGAVGGVAYMLWYAVTNFIGDWVF